MITAIDSSVIFDVLLAQAGFAERSRAAIRLARQEGSLIACESVWAEVVARFGDTQAGTVFLDRLGVEYRAIQREQAAAAGTAWREYRRRGGPRERIVSDFLVGAHAQHEADRLLTRDRGFYRSYFQGLRLLDPTA